MKLFSKVSAFLLCLALLLALCGCGDGQGNAPAQDVLNGNSTMGGSSAVYEDAPPTLVVDTDFSKDSDAMFTDRDLSRAYDTEVLITLSGSTASCDGAGVTVDGSTVTITADGTYTLRGELNGSVIVNCPDTAKPQIVLDGAKITNKNGAAICILRGDKVVLLLAPDSDNALIGNGAYAMIDGENVDGALFSKQDITLGGEGSLTLLSSEHGIVGKDDVVISGGSYTITAASHGIDANDSVRITQAELQITAGKDAMHIENLEDNDRGFFYMESGSVSATADGDGIDASGYAHIKDGTLQLTTGGGYQKGASSGSSTASTKGIKAVGSLLIEKGTVTLDSADDAVHSNTSAVIAGGALTIATGDDALHADQTLQLRGGKIVITHSYEGLEAQDIEVCGGDIAMKCIDDGINAAGGTDGSGAGGMFGGDQFGGPGRPGGPGSTGGNGLVLIGGGSLYINASGDGIDANGTLTITGGLITVCGPTQGDTAVLDYDKSGTITGGTFVGTGAKMMAQTLSSTEQGVLSFSVGKQAAGTAIKLSDSAGNVLISCEPAMSYAIVIISTPELVKGETYTVDIGGETTTHVAQ